MAAFTEANVETILSACSANSPSLAEALSRCFEQSYRIEIGESGSWSPTEVPSEVSGPGLLCLIQVESQGLAVLIPESLPLPEWHANPDDSQQARLETLSLEWSASLIPPECHAEKSGSLVVANLSDAVGSMVPPEWAATCELLVFDADPQSDRPAAKLLIVWPLEQPKFELQQAVEPEPPAKARTYLQEAPPAVPTGSDPLARLRNLPVSVSVRLAEKKIPLSQLLSVTPGMLIMFNKSCDDLLDLYVNNSRYCRGEAVKIGENFGLKINQVGIVEETPHKVIDA